jgi:hypothetical protein
MSVTRAAFVAGVLLASALPSPGADPPAGTVGATKGDAVAWVGTAPGGVSPGPQLGDHDGFCQDGVNCEYFVLTLTGTPADWQGLAVRVFLRWNLIANDYDLYVHQGGPTGPIVAQSPTGPSNFEQDDIDPAEDGTGVFYVHVVYFAATAADQYRGTATVVAKGQGLPPAPVAAGLPPRYQSHTPTAAQIAAGMTRNTQDEPNVGVNWRSGNVFLQALLQTLKVKFSDQVCAQTPPSSWTDVSPPTAATSFDPILFTDHDTGRTFVSHLLLNPLASASAFTDNDGTSWTPSQGAGPGSGIDHQTVGGGPFHEPVPPGVVYPNAVYYCAQDIAFANCASSVDGGLTFGPAVPIYTLQECEGLHGHVKVAPDGTVYVPNASCVGTVNPNENAVAVSEDNGVTWDVRTVGGTVGAGGSDPSVATDEAGRVYLGFVDDDRNPAVAVSDDQGVTWTNIYDVGAMVGVKNAVFPAMVAGGPGRAAMAFYANTTAGDANSFSSEGVWHLYVAHTYDGGASWITVNATPNDPLQRGGIHLGGGSQIHRNLLDFFDADVDAQGRMVAGYADGCLDACVQSPDTARGNSYTAYGTIARQTGGRRLFAQFDPAEPTVPGAPRLTATRNGSIARLTWSQSEDGGSPITSYKVYRRALDAAPQLLATLGGSPRTFLDQSGDPRVTYAYRVVAASARGESCGTNEVVAEPAGSSCVAPGLRVVTDAAGDQDGAPLDQDMDIQWIAIGEPYFADGSRKLAFTMKVATLDPPPPNRIWRILWNYPDPPVAPHPGSTSFVGRYYIGMNTDGAGAASFEYGIAANLTAVVANVMPPVRLGAADAESAFASDGTITMVIPADAVGGPEAGDLIGGLLARTFPVAQDETLRSDSASDTVPTASAYGLVGNAFCQSPPPTVNCFQEDDAHVAYSKGWHAASDPDASGGRFRVNTGKDSQHGLSFVFEVPAGARGAIVYHFARSKKGGTADVFVDGVFRQRISYQSSTGSLHDPQFGFNARYGDIAPGSHVFELRNLQGPAYADRFCLESAFTGAAATSGPGATASSLAALAAGASTLLPVSVPPGMQALSVVASAAGAAPIRLVLVDPVGVVLQQTEAADGLAVIERPLTQPGLYQVRAVNLGAGPQAVWTAATPWGPR